MGVPLRSALTTEGRRMAGARSLWRANGMRDDQVGKPIIAVVNSFTQLVPGHVHLHDIGQQVKGWIEARGCFAAEFDTIAIDDGIAMGHDGMLYSLPSRELIADSVEYMANAHRVDALVCISNCDKITPGHAHGSDAPEHPRHVRLGRAHGGRASGREALRPGRRDGRRGRPVRDRRGGGRRRGGRLSHLRVLLGHVYSQLHELPHRGAGHVPSRKWDDRGHPRDARAPLREGGSPHRGHGGALVRCRRRVGPSPVHRDPGGVHERDGTRHRDGRVHEHGAAPAGRGQRGKGRLHDGRHRRALAQGALPVQGRAELLLPRGGREQGGRNPRHPRRARPRGAPGHLGEAGGRPDPRPGARRVGPPVPVRLGRRDGHVQGSSCREAQPRHGLPGRAPRRPRPGQGEGLHQGPRALLLRRRRPGGPVRQPRRAGLHREDGRRGRLVPQVPRACPGVLLAGERLRRHPRRRGAGRRRGRSSATRAHAAAPGCRRCSTPPRTSRAGTWAPRAPS